MRLSRSGPLQGRMHLFGVEDYRMGPAAGRVGEREESGRSRGRGVVAGVRGPDRADRGVVAGHAVQHGERLVGSGYRAGADRGGVLGAVNLSDVERLWLQQVAVFGAPASDS